MQNQQDPTTKSINSSTKWIDYSEDESGPQFSDSDEEQNGSKRGAANNNNTNNEQYSLSDINRDMVWLLVEITSGNTKQASSRLYDLKHDDERTQVYATVKGEYNKYDLKVSKDLAQKLMLKGIEDMRNLTFKIHIRNFERRDDGPRGERRPRGEGRGRGGRGDRGDRGDRGGRGQRGERGQRGDRRNRGDRGDRGDRKDGQKKKYVDKETGKQSQTKKLFQQRIAQQKNRQYTKKQSKEIGESLGSFRNRPLEERREQKQHLKEQQQQQDKEKQKENKDKQVPEKKPEPKPKTTWNRKPTQEEVIPEATQENSNVDSDKKSATTQEKRKQSQEIQKPESKKGEEVKNQDDGKDKKVHYPKKEPKTYKPAPARIDVNEETTRLFKKTSDIRDDKEYRSAGFNENKFQPAPEGNFKKNDKSKERKNYQQRKQPKGDDQTKNNDGEANKQQQQLQKQHRDLERNYKKKFSQQRQNNNYGRNQKPRKYQQKKQKNEDKKEPEQAKKEDKKEDKKNANHFHGMMSDDSDN